LHGVDLEPEGRAAFGGHAEETGQRTRT
jgi:hypothetical protein